MCVGRHAQENLAREARERRHDSRTSAWNCGPLPLLESRFEVRAPETRSANQAREEGHVRRETP